MPGSISEIKYVLSNKVSLLKSLSKKSSWRWNEWKEINIKAYHSHSPYFIYLAPSLCFIIYTAIIFTDGKTGVYDSNSLLDGKEYCTLRFKHERSFDLIFKVNGQYSWKRDHFGELNCRRPSLMAGNTEGF